MVKWLQALIILATTIQSVLINITTKKKMKEMKVYIEDSPSFLCYQVGHQCLDLPKDTQIYVRNVTMPSKTISKNQRIIE